jgi:hypothetical protein
LKELNLPHRSLYHTRHTFITHFLEKTKDPISCARLTHNSKTGVKTIMEHYAAILYKINIPDLY